MRISTHQAFLTGLQGILAGQANVVQLQEQIASGKRVNTPADDPIASSQIIALNQQVALIDQFKGNADLAESRLNLEEAVLDSIKNSVQRVRQLTVQAGNDALDDTGRKSIGAELEQRVEELLGLLNTRGLDNEYIFSGYQTNVEPFVRNQGGGFSYQGDEGQLFLAIASNLNVATSDAGLDLFVDLDAPNNFTTVAAPANTGTGVVDDSAVTNQAAYDAFYPNDAVITFSVVGGNTTYSVTEAAGGTPVSGGTPLVPLTNVPYIPGEAIQFEGIQLNISGAPADGDVITALHSAPAKQDLLTTVENLALGLGSQAGTAVSDLQRHELIADSLISLDNALSSVTQTQAKIGARLTTIENSGSANEDLKLISQKVLSEVQDLDYNEVISQLSQSNFVLQAAQQSYVAISNLSLFTFIR